MKRVLKWLICFLAALILIALLAWSILRGKTWLDNRTTGMNSVDEGVFVPLCGQEQYLLIRGEDINNPVIVWLHGGPSSPDSYVNYTFQKHLVDDYTIVNWDQRGCGRTYFRNAASDPRNTTATFEQAVADLDALVDYLRARFGKEQVIIAGHSYGTMLGSRYALTHPEKVAAFIGVGQVVTMESDLYSYQHALETARAAGDDTTSMEAAHARYMADGTLTSLLEMRNATSRYHKAEKEANTILLGAASPFMGLDDLRWFLKQLGDMNDYMALNNALFDSAMNIDVRDFGMAYRMPVGFITGSCDWTTPVKFSQDYCEAITAPQKQFHLMEGCGHAPQFAEPEKFSALLKTILQEYGL